MTRTTVPASKGSATFADSQVVVDLTVLNTLPGDVVEIIDDTSLAVLGTALQVGTSTTWRASLTLPASVTMVNISARNRRGLAYSGKLANPFAISYPIAPAPTSAYRYWRIYITSNNGDAYTAMQQVELRTSVGGVSVCPTSPVTSESDFFAGNMNTASRLCNRNYTEFQLVPWVSATDVPVPHWIYIDLGSPMKIIEAAIFCQNFSGGPARAPKDFLIQGSDNPTNWTTYTTATGINSWIPGTGKVFAVQPGLVLTA